MEGSHEKPEDILTCMVCLKLFDSPVILPCSHSICESHVKDLKLENNRQVLRCPMCRAVTALACIVKNRDLEKACELLEKNRVPVDEGIVKVDGHFGKDVCVDHVKEKMPVTIWCADCDLPVCGLCVVEKSAHEGHKVIPFIEAGQHLKAKLHAMVTQINLDKTISDISQDIDYYGFVIDRQNRSLASVQEFVRKEFSAVSQELDRKMLSMLQQIFTLYNSEMRSAQYEKDQLHRLETTGSRLKTGVSALLAKDSLSGHAFAKHVASTGLVQNLKNFPADVDQALPQVTTAGAECSSYDAAKKYFGLRFDAITSETQKCLREQLRSVSEMVNSLALDDAIKQKIIAVRGSRLRNDTASLQSVSKNLRNLRLQECILPTTADEEVSRGASDLKSKMRKRKRGVADTKCTRDKIRIHCSITTNKKVRTMKVENNMTAQELHCLIKRQFSSLMKDKSQENMEVKGLKIRHRGADVPADKVEIWVYGIEKNSVLHITPLSDAKPVSAQNKECPCAQSKLPDDRPQKSCTQQ